MAFTFVYRPPSYLNLPVHPHGGFESRLNTQLDRDIPLIFSSHATLQATAIQAPLNGNGFAVNFGASTVTGSLTAIVSGLTKVEHVVASIDNGATATNYTVTARVHPSDLSKIDLYVWMPTASGDTTPIAATGPVVVRWWVSGEAETTT